MKYHNNMTLKENLEWLFRVCTGTKEESVHAREKSELTEQSLIDAEQTITDMDLQSIETEQALTDMDLRLLELEVANE